MSWMASRLNLSRQAVGRAVQQLTDQKLLTMQQRPRKLTAFSIRRLQPKKFFLSLYNINETRQSGSTDLIYCYIRYRQGSNDNAWPHVSTICEDLGLSKSTVLRAIAELEAAGQLSVRHAHGGLKQGNRYQVKSAFDVTKQNPRSESGVSKCNANNNTSAELKKDNPVSIAPQELSARRRLLVDYGVAWPVAESLAKSHSQDDLENAILNAEAQRQLKRSAGSRFNLPAYIVATLNRSRRENHGVQLNRYMQQQKAAWMASRSKKPLSEQLQAAHVENCKRKALRPDVLKALGLSDASINSIQSRLTEVA